MKDDAFRLAELERRLAATVLVGKVAEVDYATARVRVEVGPLLLNWMPWCTTRAGPDRHWEAPEVGEQVVVLCPGGEPAAGIVCGSLFQAAHPANGDRATLARRDWGDGASLEYDRQLHRFTLSLPDDTAEVRILTAGKVTISADKSVHVIAGEDALVQANGDVQVEAAGNASIEAAAIEVTGPTTFHDPVTLEGTLDVTGQTTLQDTKIKGTDAVPGGNQF